MKIFILGNAQRPGVTTQSEKLLPLLEKHFEVVLVDLEQKEDLSKYKDTLELIFTILTPLMANEKDLFWAMSTPVPEYIFFSTDSFHEFFGVHKEEKNKNK